MAPIRPLRALGTLVAVAALAGCGGSGGGSARPSPSPRSSYARKLLDALDRTAVEKTRSDMMAIASAIGSYAAQVGTFPLSEDMSALERTLSPTYIHVLPKTDAWARAFLFLGTPDGWSLTAPGPDGEVKTGDDIVLTDRGFTKLPDGYRPM